MKFHVTAAEGRNLVTGYGDGYVSINHERFEHPVIVAPEHAVHRWEPSAFEQLTREHFERLLDLSPELVIFGSGAVLRFPHPELTRSLANAGVGVEVMDTRAACRTYNVVMAEARRVVAAILV